MMVIQSQKLHFIGRNLCALKNSMVNNQEMLRYIYYSSDNPLANEVLDENNTLIEQSDINFNDLYKKQIFFSNVNTKIVQDSKVFVFLHPHYGQFAINDPLSKEVFSLDVCFPLDHYFIESNDIEKTGVRPYFIGQYFFKDIDRNDNVTGIGQVFLNSYTEDILNDKKDFGIVKFLFIIRNSTINC